MKKINRDTTNAERGARKKGSFIETTFFRIPSTEFRAGSEAGVSLVEVMLATVIMTTVLVGMALLFPRAMKALAKIQTRSAATGVASTQMDATINHPYAIIPVTPDGPPDFDYFPSTGSCDCSNVNWSMTIPGGNSTTNPHTVTAGNMTYTVQTCVNYIQNSQQGWVSNCTKDTGLKYVGVHVSWTLGNENQSYTMTSLASPPAALTAMSSSTGTVSVKVCPADGNLPPNCNMANLSAVQSAEVALYNSFGILVENAHIVPNGNIVSLQAPPGQYTLHVQQTGYFPYYSPINAINVTAGQTTSVTVKLRDTHKYGSQLAGEASVASHPVISKVIDAVAQPTGGCAPPGPLQTPPTPFTGSCDDASEAVEIYNPTTSTFTVGPVAGSPYPYLSLQFCNTATCWPNSPTQNFMTDPGRPTFLPAGVNVYLYPGSYLLIVGQDKRQPPNQEWGIQPDISYNAFDQKANGGTGEGLIP